MEVGQVVGASFFLKHCKSKPVKLTCGDERHHDMQYGTGAFHLKGTFQPHGEGRPGGLYFCELNKIGLHMMYWMGNRGSLLMVYMRDVSFQVEPPLSRIYVETDRFKTNAFILGPKKLLFPFLSPSLQELYVSRYVTHRHHPVLDPAYNVQELWDVLANSPKYARTVQAAIPSPSARTKQHMLNAMATGTLDHLRFMNVSLLDDPDVLNAMITYHVGISYIPLPLLPQCVAFWQRMIPEDAWWAANDEQARRILMMTELMEVSEPIMHVFSLLLTYQRFTIAQLPWTLQTPSFQSYLMGDVPAVSEEEHVFLPPLDVFLEEEYVERPVMHATDHIYLEDAISAEEEDAISAEDEEVVQRKKRKRKPARALFTRKRVKK